MSVVTLLPTKPLTDQNRYYFFTALYLRTSLYDLVLSVPYHVVIIRVWAKNSYDSLRRGMYVVENMQDGEYTYDDVTYYNWVLSYRSRALVIALLVVIVILRRLLGAGIYRQAGVADINLFADVQIADG